MQVYCDHSEDNIELGTDVTLTAKKNITLTHDNYAGKNDVVTQYLDQYGRTPLTVYSCNYCQQVSGKSPNVAFITGIENDNLPIEFVRLRYNTNEEMFYRDPILNMFENPEGNLLCVTGYD